jgi:hypothetical protein
MFLLFYLHKAAFFILEAVHKEVRCCRGSFPALFPFWFCAGALKIQYDWFHLYTFLSDADEFTIVIKLTTNLAVDKLGSSLILGIFFVAAMTSVLHSPTKQVILRSGLR